MRSGGSRRFGRIVAAFALVAFVQNASGVAAETTQPQAPQYGDLSHLTFTATGPLAVRLVSPGNGAPSDSSAPTFVVTTVRDAGVELVVGGHIVPFTKIGRRVVTVKTGETEYDYYGVPLEEGPNSVVVTALGANGMRGPSETSTVFGPGHPVRLDASLSSDAVADGRTPITYTVAGTDRYGHHAAPGAVVKVTIVRGDAHVLATTESHPQAPTPLASGEVPIPTSATDVVLGDGGIGHVTLFPGVQPGELRVRATLADLAVETQGYLAPYLRKPMVLGLATAGVGVVPGVPGERTTDANDANARRARLALYGVGKISRTAQAQLAYDTADSLQATSEHGAFVDNPQERVYQTYGDASQRRDDALSRDHLYARIDANRSSAMWGEFQASTAGATGDGFQQLVAGAKLEIAGNNAKVSVFNARNDVAYARQLFAPSGLATLGTSLHPNVVVGSDTVTLVTLDRRTGAAIAQIVLARNVDYTLDYGTGQLHFIAPPLPFDLNFNPQTVLVQYEYGGAGASAQTTGGRMEAGLGAAQNVRIGAGYVDDSTGSGNFALFGQDVTGKLPGGSWSIAHETSAGSLGASNALATSNAAATLATPQRQGNAYRAALAESAGANRIAFNFDATSAGYQNPFGGVSTAGLLDYRIAYQRLLGKATDSLTLAFDHQQNTLPNAGNAASNAAFSVREHVTKRLALHGGINQLRSHGAIPTASTSGATNASSGATTQLDVGAEYRIAPTIALGVDRIALLAGGQEASQPSQTTAQLSIDTPHHGKFYVREQVADAPVQSFAAATTSLTTASASTRSTALGFEQALGTNTTFDSEYAVENTGSGSDIYSSLGGRERFVLGSHLHGDAQLQHAASIGSDGGGFYGYGIDLAYAVANRFRASANYHLRTGSSPGTTLDLGAAGALSENVSVVATASDSQTTGFHNVDERLSLAYRPALDDRAVTLFGLEARNGDVSALGARTQLLSLEELYRPTGRLEIAGRYAYKLDGDAYYAAHSSLLDLRATQRIGTRFDLGSEIRALASHGISGASNSGFAIESGYRLGGGMRLAAGYQFSGSPDPALAVAPTRRGFYGTMTSVIDRVFGWGKDER